MKNRSATLSVLIAAMFALAACGGQAAPPTATAAPAKPTDGPKPAATAAPAASTAPPAKPTDTPKPTTPGAYKIVPGQSKASYTVNEVFINRGNILNTAIGVTTVVNGEITLDPADPSKTRVGEITIDLSAFASDSGQRDNFIRRNSLESSKFPLARFKPTALAGLPSAYKEGDELKFKMTGDMTVRETTIPVSFDVTAKLTGGKLTGTATAQVKMTDFKFNPPDIAGTLKADDEVKLKLEFVAMP
ncbi:MAG: YceI family protein [Thermoflexales bacterium]